MNRKHYSPNHPAVMAWHNANRDSELSVKERRQAVINRMPCRKTDNTKFEGLLGLAFVVASGFVMDHAEEVGGDWWLLVGMLLGGGGAMIVDAVRRANP